MALLGAKTYAIDRIVGDTALCECLQTDTPMLIERKALPPGAKEGDVIRQEGTGFVLDSASTEARRRDLTNRMNRLFDRHK